MAEVGEHGEHAAVVVRRCLDVQLREDVADVALDGLWAEPEGAADALVRASFGDQDEDLAFAWGELVERVRLAAAADELIDDVSVDYAFAGRHTPERV